MRTAHRPNVVLWLLGAVLIIIGVVLTLLGLIWAFQAMPDAGPQLSDLDAGPDARRDLAPMADGFSVVVAGCTVLTVGRYLWRGARRRGWRDRLGRLMLIIGYVLVATALIVLTRFALAALGNGDPDESTRIILTGLIACAAIATPGVLLAMPGMRLANEQPLMNAEASASL